MSNMPRFNRVVRVAIPLLAVVLMTPCAVRAMPASPHAYRVTQPGGAVITVYIRGDEYFHWEEDEKGYTVLRDAAGTYVYATLDAQGNLAPTALKVGVDNPAAGGLQPGTLPPFEARNRTRAQAEALMRQQGGVAGESPPGVGTFKNVVILMRFANHLGRTLPSNPDIDILFNSPTPHALAPTGSVKGLYFENSYGLMTLNSTVFGWVDLPQTEQYYAAGNSGLGSNIWEAITDALEAADPLIDFSQFDDDLDGYVDTITFVHSGYAAEWGGTDADGTDFTNRIWSHRWAVFPEWVSDEGVKVFDYDINPGLWGTSGSAIGRIGVICHETGHFFGLPDLYDTDNNGPAGIGSWCMMSNSWGFTGDQLNPPHFSAWCKQFLGWVTPTVISASGTYSARRVEQFPDVYRINAGYSAGEYLLVENRQPYGFESTMPQGGLCVWHIDEAKGGNTEEGYPGQPGWPGNNRHYMVALLQADGFYDLEHGFTYGDSGDVYHAGGVSRIDGATIPNTHGYQGGTVVATNHRLHNISSSGTPMTFDFDSYAPASGACCNDLTGVCTDNEQSDACMQSGRTRFVEGGTCAGLFPPCMSSVPENDNCADAIPIFDGFTFFDTELASTDGPADCLNGDPRVGKQDLWYTYQATCSGLLLVSLCTATDYDSTLQIYDGMGCAPLGTQLGCSDDDCGIGGGPSELTRPVGQDQMVLIRVAGWQTERGAGFVQIECEAIGPPPTPTWDCVGGDLRYKFCSDGPSAGQACVDDEDCPQCIVCCVPCAARTRALSFRMTPPATATGGPGATAIKITMVDLQNPVPANDVCCPPPNFGSYESATCNAAGEAGGCARWVGPPYSYLEAQELPGFGNYRASRLQCTPYYDDWENEPNQAVNVVGAEILPSSTYAVQSYGTDCKGTEASCSNVSASVQMQTRRAGDIAPVFQDPAANRTQPNAIDIVGTVNNFKKLAGAPKHLEAQVQPNLPNLNRDVDALDIQAIVANQKLGAYPYNGPCACPSTVTCNAIACSGTTPCISGNLCLQTCSAGPRMGELCTSNKHCGMCVGGSRPGIPCDNSSQCDGGTCTTGTCATQGFCRDRCGRCN